MKIERKYLLACLLLFLLAAVATYSGRLWSEMGDSWEHAASVQELAFNLRNPSNPFLVAEGGTTPRFTLYILLLALVKRVSGLPVIDLMELAGIFNLLLLVTGVYAFTRAYTRNSHQPFFTLITLLLFWGRGWLYSSEYSLQFLTSSLFHPSIFAFSLSFWGWYFFLSFTERKTGAALAGTALLSLLITSTHPLTAGFYFIVMFLLNFHQKKEFIPGFYLIGLSFLLSLLLMLFWPYFSIIEAFKKGALSGGWYPTGN
jgi:alpha-1,6-mannosyltransferase